MQKFIIELANDTLLWNDIILKKNEIHQKSLEQLQQLEIQLRELIPSPISQKQMYFQNYLTNFISMTKNRRSTYTIGPDNLEEKLIIEEIDQILMDKRFIEIICSSVYINLIPIIKIKFWFRYIRKFLNKSGINDFNIKLENLPRLEAQLSTLAFYEISHYFKELMKAIEENKQFFINNSMPQPTKLLKPIVDSKLRLLEFDEYEKLKYLIEAQLNGIVLDKAKTQTEYNIAVKKRIKRELKIKTKLGNNSNVNETKTVTLKKTETDQLKVILTKYGFFNLSMVENLSEANKNKIVELLNSNKIPYRIAMFNFLGYIEYLKNEHFKIKKDLNVKLSNWFNSDKDGRNIRGNINSLSTVTNENKTRYTAYKYKEKVQKDYKTLI